MGSRWVLLPALMLHAAFALAQQDFDAVKIETVPVRDGLYMLIGSGGNIGVSVGDDGVVVIDDQYAPLSERILAAIRKLSDKPLRFVLNTHWHGDHTGGNENFAAAGGVLVAHDNVRTRLSRGQLVAFMNRQVEPARPGALPVITFSESMHFHLNGQDAHVFHVPNAHTDGDSIVHFPGLDAFHMGDTYFAAMYPFIDGSSGGSVEGVIAALDRVLAIAGPETAIIPGHGKLSNRAELSAFREMLAKVSARIQAERARGATAEEIIAAKPTAEFDATYGGFLTPDRWVEMLLGLSSQPAGG